MNLASLCQRDILSLGAEASVQKAAELMRVNHVGALALTDPEDPARVVGVVTDRDLVINLLAQDRLPQEQTIGAFSTPHLIRVPGTASVHEAVQTMTQHGVRRLFITEADGRLMGLVSLDDPVHRFIPAWLATVTSPGRMAEEPVRHHARRMADDARNHAVCLRADLQPDAGVSGTRLEMDHARIDCRDRSVAIADDGLSPLSRVL